MSKKDVDKEFVEATPGNLPRVSLDMLLEYLNSHKCCNSAETLQTGRENYGDRAIGWVQIRRMSTKCVVKMTIAPEHHPRNDLYSVSLIVDEESECVESAKCTGCTAVWDGCKHIAAAVQWLNRRSEEPKSTTEVCYWSPPVFSKDEKEIEIMAIKDIAEKLTGKAPECDEDTTTKDVDFFEDIANSMKNVSSFTRQFNPQFTASLPLDLSMHILVSDYLQSKTDIDAFYQHVSSRLGPEGCQSVEKINRESENALWYEMRYGRITESTIYGMAKHGKGDDLLISRIMGGEAHEKAPAESVMELKAEVLKVIGQYHGQKISTSGLVVHPNYPVFAVCPDGVGDTFVVEVKCADRSKTIKYYCNNQKIRFKYKAQIQLQMLLCGKQKGYFCIPYRDFETSGMVEIINEDFDEDWLMAIMMKAQDFWEENIFTLLMRVPDDF